MLTSKVARIKDFLEQKEKIDTRLAQLIGEAERRHKDEKSDDEMNNAYQISQCPAASKVR